MRYLFSRYKYQMVVSTSQQDLEPLCIHHTYRTRNDCPYAHDHHTSTGPTSTIPSSIRSCCCQGLSYNLRKSRQIHSRSWHRTWGSCSNSKWHCQISRSTSFRCCVCTLIDTVIKKHHMNQKSNDELANRVCETMEIIGLALNDPKVTSAPHLKSDLLHVKS